MATKYHVVKTSCGWGLRKEGSTRMMTRNITDWADVLHKLLTSKEPAELYIHNEDGKVIRKITISEELV